MKCKFKKDSVKLSPKNILVQFANISLRLRPKHGKNESEHVKLKPHKSSYGSILSSDGSNEGYH